MNRYYDIIIIGAGAAGLLLASRTDLVAAGRTGLILEATSMPGNKLRMTGAGHCNFTHDGSVKEMVDCYGPRGKAIRRILYRYNNDSFRDYMAALDLPSYARADGRVFPRCEDGEQVRQVLLSHARENGFELKINSAVRKVFDSANPLCNSGMTQNTSNNSFGEKLASVYEPACNPKSSEGLIESNDSCEVHTKDTGVTDESKLDCGCISKSWQVICDDDAGITYETSHLVIATGGKSYPSTGSNGHMWKILEWDLGIRIVTPRPALTPICVLDYPYSELAGLSFPNILLAVTTPGRKIIRSQGDLLLTHRNFSGPAALNLSADAGEGVVLHINYLPDIPAEEVTAKISKVFASGKGSPANALASLFGLPKRFCEMVIARSIGNHGQSDSGVTRRSEGHAQGYDGLSPKRVSQILMDDTFTVTGEADWNVAMATRGGIDLGELALKTMEFREHPGLYAIGEALDVDGRTGGYNLQFAYSSAAVCAEALQSKLDCLEKRNF